MTKAKNTKIDEIEDDLRAMRIDMQASLHSIELKQARLIEIAPSGMVLHSKIDEKPDAENQCALFHIDGSFRNGSKLPAYELIYCVNSELYFYRTSDDQFMEAKHGPHSHEITGLSRDIRLLRDKVVEVVRNTPILRNRINRLTNPTLVHHSKSLTHPRETVQCLFFSGADNEVRRVPHELLTLDWLGVTFHRTSDKTFHEITK
jgi:hypothetical protein